MGLTAAAQQNLDDATAYLSSRGAPGRIGQEMNG
jgi:hypothetical protein